MFYKDAPDMNDNPSLTTPTPIAFVPNAELRAAMAEAHEDMQRNRRFVAGFEHLWINDNGFKQQTCEE